MNQSIILTDSASSKSFSFDLSNKELSEDDKDSSVPVTTSTNKEKYEYSNNDQFLGMLQKMRNYGVATDVSIISSDKLFSSHKLILNAVCSYFNKMLVCEEPESVVMNDLNPDVIETFLAFLYTGEADVSNLSPAQTKALMYMGRKVDFPNFNRLLFESFLLSLNSRNFGSALFLGEYIGETKNLDIVIKYMAQNLGKICHSHDFVAITENKLLYVLSEAGQILPCHDLLLEALIQWINYSPQRLTKIHFLLPYINEHRITKQLAVKILENENTILKCKSLSEMMERICNSTKSGLRLTVDMETTTEASLSENSWMGTSTDSSKTSSGTAVIETNPMFVLVGQDEANRTCISTYNINERNWSSLEDMHLSLEIKPGVGYYQGKIFLLGGTDMNGCKLRNCYAYDIRTKHINVLTNLRIARSEAIVFGANDNIYITGGLGRYASDGLSHMEYLKLTNENAWKNAPSMHRHRNEKAGICQIGERVYVVGGGSHICEYYDIINNQWNVVGKLPNLGFTGLDDFSPFLAAANEQLYVVGPFKPSKLMILDTKTHTWSQLTTKNNPPVTVLCSVGYGSNIYTLDNNKKLMRLNTDTGYWSSVTKIPKNVIRPVYLTCVNDAII